MCELCQMQYRADHEEQEGPLCRCGRFHLGPDEKHGFQGCYHCFMEQPGQHDCEICAASENN